MADWQGWGLFMPRILTSQTFFFWAEPGCVLISAQKVNVKNKAEETSSAPQQVTNSVFHIQIPQNKKCTKIFFFFLFKRHICHWGFSYRFIYICIFVPFDLF